jgi:hypothetical protein
MLKSTVFIASIAICFPSLSLEYKMVKGDTLWALSNAYLKDPYLWPQITYLDGTKVSEPRSMPIGTLLLINKDIANSHALTELVEEKIIAKKVITNKNEQVSKSKSPFHFVVNPSIQKMLTKLNDKEKNRLWDYYLTDKEGLVRAFYNGQEVVIDVKIIIDQLRHLEGKNK